ncbi:MULTISPECIES: RES family NAD+ phosphorylase [unclassified Oleiphilus]|uniref:RES family NAD+ phosphorylase n=1 Tax=unclassified Oleiphilus TaxID=2631174 RepID=UPI001E4E7486|nr:MULTISPECIES: RES family NAD+ phosphorylase [unclassified Oleiphilus]
MPSHFPPIHLFESIYDSEEELKIAYQLEGLTNDRLAQEAGSLCLIRQGDFITGPGATPVMAAFTHIGYPSRFTDGQFGVYYSASDIETAIRETMHHKAMFLSATKEGDTELTMREYVNEIVKPLVDIRGDLALHKPNCYKRSQAFGKNLYDQSEWGVLYNSVRNQGGECAALLRPPANSCCTQGAHYRYVWNGQKQRFQTHFKISAEPEGL